MTTRNRTILCHSSASFWTEKQRRKKVFFFLGGGGFPGMYIVNVFSNHRAHSWRLRRWVKYQREAGPAKQARVKNGSSLWISGQKATRTPNRLITCGESLDKNDHYIHLIHCTQRDKRGWAVDTFWPRAVIPRRLTVHRRIIIVKTFWWLLGFSRAIFRFSLSLRFMWSIKAVDVQLILSATCDPVSVCRQKIVKAHFLLF